MEKSANKVKELRETLFNIERRMEEKCNLGHVHVIQPEIFRIPTPEETKAWRRYRRNDKYLPIAGL